MVAGVIAGLAVAGGTGSLSAEPVVPDDTPWTVDDADPGRFPKSIEDLLAREADDEDVSSPSKPQPSATPPSPPKSEPRPDTAQPPAVETARERLPDVIRPVEPRLVAPAPRPAMRPETAPPIADVRVQAQEGLGPNPNAGTPAPDPVPPAPSVAQSVAPPPTPAPQVTQPSVALNGKIYLPLKRYLDTRAETELARYPASDRAALAAHYEKTVGEALWVSRTGFNEAARALIAEIEKAGEWGLSASDYLIPQLEPRNGDYAFGDLAAADVKLSLVAMAYARHARGGRIDTPTEQLSSYIDRKPQIIEAPKVLAALLAAPDKGEYLRSLHPKHPQFGLMRQKLAELHAHRSDGTLPQPVPMGPKLTPGKEHAHVALVRSLVGTPVPTRKPDGSPARDTYFDEDLARAIIGYKTKQQIEPATATITDTLRKSLNARASLDESTLIANMEQWRWMPDDLGETHVWVNVPEFVVRVKKDGTTLHEERIVAGRYETQTPIFSNRMRTVVFQPYWNVPDSIKVNELLPGLRAGRNPIAEQGLEVKRGKEIVDATQIDWNRQDIRNYHIYQPPGPKNVLGVVKFLFPNKHAVYLHDTPAKKLFNERLRTFSHGCMRVRDPVRLAEVIMAEDKGWASANVQQLVSEGPPDNEITLDRPIPVHVSYFTAWVSDDGTVAAFPDIYGHEKRIKLALAGRWEEIDKGADHLAPADPNVVATRDDTPADTGTVTGTAWRNPDLEPPAPAPRPVTRRLARSPGAAPLEFELPQTGMRQTPGAAKQSERPAKRKRKVSGDFMSNIFNAN
jgi:murein L,D-transpeptidase YcbB/YkuD